MSTAEYPNRDALRKAHDKYLAAICQFIISRLGKDIIEDELDSVPCDDVVASIDFGNIPYLVRKYWETDFNQYFYNVDPYYEARSTIQLIVEGRNRTSHPPWDLDPEFTRTQLFLVAELLGKINRPDKQREVEAIRDELFFDDTAERLAEAEERLKVVEAKNAEYKKSIAEAKKRSKGAESEKNEYIEKNAVLLQNVDEKEKQRKKLDRNLKNAKERNNKLKSEVAGGKKRLEESEEAKADYKTRLDTKSKELKDTRADLKRSEERFSARSNELVAVQAEKRVSEECLVATRNLLTTVTINDLSVFPPLGTDSPVWILDRRGTDKRNYLLGLLEQKRPTIIYVQSEEKINQLLGLVGSENAKVIGKHDAQTSDAQEMEILEKLESGELIAVVSNASFSTLTLSHCVEHFVFCHLVPGLGKFFKQCEPAFTSAKNVYLHLIYNSEQDVEGLVKKYLDRETLGKLYTEVKKIAGTNGDFINSENVCNALDMEKPAIETGLAIFEELRLLERNEMRVKLLPKPKQKRELDESETYCAGEKLKQDVANFRDFQLEKSIEEIWVAIKEKVDIDDEQILRESGINKISPKFPEIESDVRSAIDTEQITSPIEVLKDFQTQSERSTETVETDSIPDNETAEARLIPKPSRRMLK